MPTTKPPSFADELRPHVERLGTGKAAALCDVTPRTLQLWLAGQGNPNTSTRVGALMLLRNAKGKPPT